MSIKTVKVPREMEYVFEDAQRYVTQYFENRQEDPTKGVIVIGGERYVLVRAAALSAEFWEFVKSMYPGLDDEEAADSAASIMFDIAHAIGKADAKVFHEATGVTDPLAKLSTGPIHFSYSGWAFVDILPESKPSPDEDYCLVYDHPYSFEADSWIKLRRRVTRPVCTMNAGYSSGWCEESFGVELTAREIACRARGDEFCRFVMAHPSRVDGFIQDYLERHPELRKA
jgi:two-component system cell cycle sensor histidine kinase/response regulator CckA